MSKPNQLFLLADHIKLSLLERQRAQSLDLEGGGSQQDGHVSRSLEQFRDGLEALREEEARLRERGDEDAALTIADSLPSLQKQLDDLTSQFHGFSSPSTTATLTHPNDPSLSSDFTHAQSFKPLSPAASKPTAGGATAHKSVRFSDTPSTDLFARYTDSPDPATPEDRTADMTNAQIHAYHSSVLEEQDEQLDRLGESISRQRELSMRMGDELEAQVEMLDETEGLVDRHQGRLDRAGRSLAGVARRASGEGRQMGAIILTIIILIVLIAILK
ncbi:related to syntaxin 8 [Cephalotrichum gorgonifer]|uniref:Related to syntaxin 8 n=1 Tax=Cephalotrichum gorgonifer TaxID=2041049 RepID=A0AAE8SXZ2_9PEZI|nr:related to syntaxin 8 [Cephalotrichum gorgonifer]